MTTDTSPPLKQRAYEARLRERGGKRLPGGTLQPDAAAALYALVAAGYAPSATAAIARALMDAQAAMVKRSKRATQSGVKD